MLTPVSARVSAFILIGVCSIGLYVNVWNQPVNRRWVFSFFFNTNQNFTLSDDTDTVDNCDNLWDYGREIQINGSWEWRPIGCNLADYRASASALRVCAERLPQTMKKDSIHVVFIGDSRMRQLQASLYRVLNGQSAPTGRDIPLQEYCDIQPFMNFSSNLAENERMRSNPHLQTCPFNRSVTEYNLKIERWWAPHFMPSVVGEKLRRLLARPYSAAPTLVLINYGLWLIADCGKGNVSFADCYKNYTRNILALKTDLMQLAETSTVVWVLQNNMADCRDWWRWRANTRINIFNDVAVRIFDGTKIKIWRSFYQIFDLLGSNGDGPQMSGPALEVETQIILNNLCNSVVQGNLDYCCARRHN